METVFTQTAELEPPTDAQVIQKQLERLSETASRKVRFVVFVLLIFINVHWILSFRSDLVWVPCELSLIFTEALFVLTVVSQIGKCRYIPECVIGPVSLMIQLGIISFLLVFQFGHLASHSDRHKLCAVFYLAGAIYVFVVIYLVYKARRCNLRAAEFEKTGKLRYIF